MKFLGLKCASGQHLHRAVQNLEVGGKPRDSRVETQVEGYLVVLKRAPNCQGMEGRTNNTILKTSAALVCVRSQPFTRRTGLCTGGSTR